MKKYQPLLLSLFSGLLLFLAWPMTGITVAIFIAFIPLFIMEQYNLARLKYFGLIYLALFIWNITTTWWIWNASMVGAWLAIFVNSLLMCIPWMGFRFMKNRFGALIGYSSFIVFWLAFEYLHLQDWGLSWPWLTLGNVFASKTEWIQWYEYTGTSGGSLWILLTNVLLFRFFFNVRSTMYDVPNWKAVIVVAILVLPLGISLLINKNRSTEHRTSNIVHPTSNIVIIQPNIDPYDKLSTGTFDAQLQKLIRLSESKVDSNTTLLVWPETALYAPNGFDETTLKLNFFLNPLFDFLRRHPQLNLFTGIESYRLFNEKISNVARPINGTTNFYEVYNGSVLLDSNGARNFYHKSMLVPGVETLPRFLLFLGPVFEKLGGTTGGYARQTDRTPVATTNGYIIAPAICYESIYGEYMSRYIANGANIIAIITNDGWWDNTPGHKHHLLYAKLRAIETRKWVVRSANTGISCFIDAAGNILEPQPWWTEAAIKMHVPVTNNQTFYVRFGDLISKLALVLAALLILYGVYYRFSNKRSTYQKRGVVRNKNPKIMKYICFYFCLILLFFSCKKDELPKETQQGLNTFGCYINGTPFVPSSTLGGNITPVSAFFARETTQLYKAGFLSIEAHDVTYSSPFAGSIVMQKIGVKGTGEYSLTNVFNCVQPYDCDAGGYNNSARTNTYFIESGNLTITKLDTTKKIISGRFFFTAKDSLNNRIEVTKGIFDISYIY